MGRAHTRYVVRHMDGGGEPLAVVDTEFAFRVSTDSLRKLAESRPNSEASWPSEEISASILLRRSA